MRFILPLVETRLIRRYKRFLADVEMPDGAVETIHCPNPGAMMGLDMPGLPTFISDSANSRRKLRYTMEMVRLADGLVGINTGHPNRLAEEALVAGVVPELLGYSNVRREVRYGGRNSRIDLLLTEGGRPDCYVEVKNVHLRRPDGAFPTAAEFPDCVTARGAKHLLELADMVAAGHRAVMLYIVQRDDCDRFRVAADLDPIYAKGLTVAMAAGVEVLCYTCHLTERTIEVDRPLPVML